MKPTGSRFEGKFNLESLADDDIVITGISGRFPLADNVEELRDNLYSKRDCVARADDRWCPDIPGFPHNRMGALKSLDKFDSEFFNMNASNSDGEDPEHRMMFEVAYETITDSGYSIDELKGRNIGVFIGLSDSDTPPLAREFLYVPNSKVAVGYIACMAANRISHKFDFAGLSNAIDSACSSSGVCLETAFHRIKDGSIEAALIGGSSTSLDPRATECYLSMGILSPNGVSCCYDEKANGMVKSEAIAAIFVQKKKDARRVYAKIHNIECISAGHVPEGIFVPSLKAEARLFAKTYETIGMDPSIIDYIEGHGTSTPIGDPTEINAIDQVFCKNRKTPLLLGGMKSNIGHTEAASAVCSIAKIILAFESGVIAPNINFETPNPKCPSLLNGTIKVITEPTTFDKPLVATNNFGFGGVNVHMILERNPVMKSPSEDEITAKIPKLVVYSARTEKALQDMFDKFHKTPKQREFFALLNKSAYMSRISHPYRGFTILKKDGPPIMSIEQNPPVHRQVWYVMTGMGCQWPGMGLDLMQLDVFAESMRKSAKVLEPFGIDLLELLKPDKDNLLQDRRITPAFVTIAAIQIALLDVLKTLGLEPDGIIGHSTGELVCSYADGCGTAEQTILSAYYRGASVESSELLSGSMAAVGLTWEEATKRCPEGVYPACHNAQDSVTISGVKEAVEKFVEQLKSENIFARVVNAYGYAFHCRFIETVGKKLKSSLQSVYKEPKLRSKRWLSTSFCEAEWEKPECQTIDADYFSHNLTSQVRFQEVLQHIPEDAITIEIGPHFLLQSILKRSVGNKAEYIGLMKKNENNVDFLLSSIGKLYNLGLNPRVENLYEPVTYPAPRGTPMISPLIQWNHTNSFRVPKIELKTKGNCKMLVRTRTTDSYLLDHCIEGRSIYPATGYIYLAWKALSDSINKPMDSLPVCIQNFKILRASILSSQDDKTFEVCILNIKGDFEIVEGNSVVATGKISSPIKPMFEDTDHSHLPDKDSIFVPGVDIYNELKIHGYEYGPAFQGLLEVNLGGTDGLVKWSGEWISFLDSLLLFFGIIHENSNFRLPTGALQIKIDPRVHMEFASTMEEKDLKGVPVKFDPDVQRCTTPGVEIQKLKLEPAPHRPLEEIPPVMEEYTFVPYNEKFALGTEGTKKCDSYIQACCHLAKQAANFLNVNADILGIFKDVNLSKSIKMEDYVECVEENHLLLKALKDVHEMSFSKKLISKIETTCQGIPDILSGDMLFQVMLGERMIRTLLDIVVENTIGKIIVSEWYEDNVMVLPALYEIVRGFPQLKLSCTLIHSRKITIDADDMSSKNISVECAKENDSIPSNFTGSSQLVFATFIMGSRDSLNSRIQKVSSLVREGGFIFFIHKHQLVKPELFMYLMTKLSLEMQSETAIEKLFSEENLQIVSKKANSFGINAYLLRKPDAKIKSGFGHVVKVQDDKYDQWVEDLKKAMVAVQQRDSCDKIFLVAQDTPLNGITGMVNCLMQEPGGDKIRCVFTECGAPPFEITNSIYADILEKNLAMNIYMNGQWGTFRHSSLPKTMPKQLTDHAYADCTKIGDLSSFQWFECPVKSIQSHEGTDELYHIYYSALNFKDIMLATGKLSSEESTGSWKKDVSILGMEFSGRDKQGRRVMALCPGGAIANTYVGSPAYVCEVPDNWTLEEAATVPVVYSTCFYSLIVRGNLRERETILIHSGSGGVGQAAIRIALGMNCEVFTTVGTPEKRKFILKTFPQIKPENIGNSRDLSFEEMIMKQTKGVGVDVVLNSLAEDKFQASVRCLAIQGRFLEIGKYDMQLDSNLGLSAFSGDKSFHGVYLDASNMNNEKGIKLFQDFSVFLSQGIRKGIVQPLNRTVFPIDDTEHAFRYMASGKHMGKVLLKVREEEKQKKMVIPPPLKVNAYNTLGLYANKSYVVIGGLGGFGIELTKWLVGKGAGSVILTSRYGVRTPYHHLCLKRWKESGARVSVSTLNVAKGEEAKRLLEETTKKYGPVGGIFNSAVVLKDAFIENQSAADFSEVCAPKAVATKHLDELTRKMSPELDMFVCFSSISCGKGNAGQSNYGYANSVMERICEKRKKDGLHGLAVQWGIIGDVGLVHRHMGDDAMIAGVMAQKIKSCLQCLETFLLQDKPVVSSFVIADKSRIKSRSDDILSQMTKMFGISDIEKMNPYRTFGEMGIDSMMGVELKQLLESTFDLTFNLQDIQDMKVEDVKKLLQEKEKEKNQGQLSGGQKITNISFNSMSVSLPTECVIPLNNRKQGIPVFFIHGNDLQCENLQMISERIQSPVFALRSTQDTPINSVEEMSVWYLKEIQRVCAEKTAIHLASVSTGANLALEMALQCEAGKDRLPDVKTLTIVDGSLDLMEDHTTSEAEKKRNAAVFESSALCEFLSTFSDSDLTKLGTQLELLPDMESRLNMINDLVPSSDRSAFIKATELHVKKRNLMHLHVTNGNLRKDITAIENSEKVLPNDVSTVKSYMAQICSGQVKFHRIPGGQDFLVRDKSAEAVASLLNDLYKL